MCITEFDKKKIERAFKREAQEERERAEKAESELKNAESKLEKAESELEKYKALYGELT